MSEAARPSLTPIAVGNEEGEAFWFFGALATIKASSETTGGRVAVIEHLAPQGVASPMHMHHNEDEWFYITGGAITFWVGGKIFQASAGSFVYGPREIPHTFVVTSPQARFLRLQSRPASKNSCESWACPLRLEPFRRARSNCPAPIARHPLQRQFMYRKNKNPFPAEKLVEQASLLGMASVEW